MKIVIPMAGVGQRFANAGFKDIKPLIDIDGKPMIERVCDMFPRDSDFIFICNREHLETTPLKMVLERINPQGKIVWINQHKKGPVQTCVESFDYINEEEEVFVNYCDLINRWDFNDFLTKTRQRGYEGAMPAFKGFHPASLGDTFYAYMKVNDRNELIKIREKGSFTDNRMEEFASAGGYYFSKGEYLKKYFRRVIDEDLSTSGEYYASIPYNLMVEDGLRVLVYEIDKHIVLGTPEDYFTYTFWSKFFSNKLEFKQEQDFGEGYTTLLPLARTEEKMFCEGYKLPKPLISVMKKPMFVNGINSLPKTSNLIVIFLEEFMKDYNTDYFFKKEFPLSKIVSLKEVTEGMACTCLSARDHFDENKPLIISSCDFIIDYDKNKLKELINNQENDVIVFSHKNHNFQRRNPYEHTYLKTDEGNNLSLISEKKPISNTPYEDPVFVGTIFFRTGKLFINAATRMIKRQNRVNGKFYVATSVNELIEEGKKVVQFEVDKYISLGTSVNLKEFEYWEDYFNPS